MNESPRVDPTGLKAVREHLASERPTCSPSILSRTERSRLVERGLHGLYRWYVDRSQSTRYWNPDRSFDWKAMRKNHHDAVHTIVEGFYAVEQYVPDYVHTLLRVIRESYGRSHFHIRWGAEEEKHGDLWRNAVLSMGRRSPEWMENYTDVLRKKAWDLPFEDPLRMLAYTVLQERATQVNYLNLGLVASGKPVSQTLLGAADPVLASACRTIAVDEAAHYNFFLEAARLFLYYFPEDMTEALVDVVRHFGMPAREIIPDYDRFGAVLHDHAIFSRRIHYRDVVKEALAQLGMADLKAVEDGIRQTRLVPAPDGSMRGTAIFETIDHDFVVGKVQRLFGRVNEYLDSAGVSHTMPLEFVQHDWRSEGGAE